MLALSPARPPSRPPRAQRWFFSGVYRGEYKLHLLRLPGKAPVEEVPSGEAAEAPPRAPPEGAAAAGAAAAEEGVCSRALFFAGLEPGASYLVEVEQDPEEYARLSQRARPLDALELARLNPNRGGH